MPITTSAIKKLKQDKKRKQQNLLVRNMVRVTIKNYKKNYTAESLSKVFKTVDMAAKKHIFHPNKAARIKSKLSKLLIKKDKPAIEAKKIKKSKTPKKSAK